MPHSRTLERIHREMHLLAGSHKPDGGGDARLRGTPWPSRLGVGADNSIMKKSDEETNRTALKKRPRKPTLDLKLERLIFIKKQITSDGSRKSGRPK
ncbi:hypothetical protein CEXT_727591 [Caerostris extrusa]|uniref:Uncharacterized protein n=1 Tax=Caerostris extrusa TaxID=172846 RepID=A0AAV4PR42_CAEEX|nr:hypothetical protein CEXT_727591 [Caerostris extrusa]